MEIKEFIDTFTNYPILFVGSGISKRYGKGALSWEELLRKTSQIIYGNEYEFDQTLEQYKNKDNPLLYVATKQEKDFTVLCNKREEKYEQINRYWDSINNNKPSRYKILLFSILNKIGLIPEIERTPKINEEIQNFIEASKNIMSVITTNYDTIIEDIIEYLVPFIGNDIYFSSIYGSIYKIHGDSSKIENASGIIITSEDYEKFKEDYKLIKSHLISLFIHNPIIFMGYSIQDSNVQDILTTIFKYVDVNSEEAKKIRNNFLLVEWEEGSDNTQLIEHTLKINEGTLITINKLKTDDYGSVFKAINDLLLTANALEIKKAMSYFYRVSTKADKSISFEGGMSLSGVVIKEMGGGLEIYKNNIPIREVIEEYFSIMETNDKRYEFYTPKKQKYMYFPVWGFYKLFNNEEILIFEKVVEDTLNNRIEKSSQKFGKTKHMSIGDVREDNNIAASSKIDCIVYLIYKDKINFEEIKDLIKDNDIKGTNLNVLITLYDYKKNKNK